MGGISLWVRAEWRRRWPRCWSPSPSSWRSPAVRRPRCSPEPAARTPAFVRFREETAPYNLEASVQLGAEKPSSAAELRSAARGPAPPPSASSPRHRRRGVGPRGVVVGDQRLPRVRRSRHSVGRSRPGRPPPTAQRHTPSCSTGALPSRGRPRRGRSSASTPLDMLGWTVGDAARRSTPCLRTGCSNGPATTQRFGLRRRPRRPGDRGRGRGRGPRRVRHRRRPLSVDPFSRKASPAPIADEIAHVEPIAMIRADPTRIDAVAEQDRGDPRPGRDGRRGSCHRLATSAPRRPDVSPSRSPRCASPWPSPLTAGVFVVAQALGRQLAAAAAEDGRALALGITTTGQATGKWLTLAPVAVIGAAGGADRGLVTERRVSDAGWRGGPSRSQVCASTRGAIVAGAATTLAVDPCPPRGPGVARITPPHVSRVSRSRRRRHACSPARPSPLGASFAVDPAGSGRSRARLVGDRWRRSPWESPPCWP